jgi:hypothetical protein
MAFVAGSVAVPETSRVAAGDLREGSSTALVAAFGDDADLKRRSPTASPRRRSAEAHGRRMLGFDAETMARLEIAAHCSNAVWGEPGSLTSGELVSNASVGCAADGAR